MVDEFSFQSVELARNWSMRFYLKPLVRSLVIDRKNMVYTTDFRKYYGRFFLNKKEE